MCFSVPAPNNRLTEIPPNKPQEKSGKNAYRSVIITNTAKQSPIIKRISRCVFNFLYSMTILFFGDSQFPFVFPV